MTISMAAASQCCRQSTTSASSAATFVTSSSADVSSGIQFRFIRKRLTDAADDANQQAAMNART